VTDIRLADISEHQDNIDAPAYLKGGHSVVIVRTFNGYRPDNKMPGRRDYLRGYDFDGIGWYAYLAADSNAADQARGFIDTIGQLRANEWAILDLEEGSGDQTGRADQWFNVVDPWAGFKSMLYSGDYFMRDCLGGSDHWGDRPLWLASYGPSEPSARHLLWQFSASYSFPGIGSCDGNLAHLSATDFVDTVRAGARAAAVPQPAEDEDMVTVVKDDGRMETFVRDESGSVWHAYQVAPNAGWAGSAPGKPATWYSLGTPGGK
jgi:GH25 family lysozyme M1 (1,4-beta-N-acetylmuramidase)